MSNNERLRKLAGLPYDVSETAVDIIEEATCTACTDEYEGPITGTDNIFIGKDKLHYIKDGEAYRELTPEEQKTLVKDKVLTTNRRLGEATEKEKVPSSDKKTADVVDNQKEKDERAGTDKVREDKVSCPADVKSQVSKRISELESAIKNYDKKGFNDESVKQQAIDCMKQIMKNLESGDSEGFKEAQVYLGTLMSPLTDLFPAKLTLFLAKGE